MDSFGKMPPKKDHIYLHELASLREGRCLSTEYRGVDVKYEWECGKCRYRWFATASNVKCGYWCPECAGNVKKNIGYLRKLATQKMGECLSIQYTNMNSKYEWECGKCGCRWWATANSIQRGAWCPSCAGNTKKDINHLHKLACQNGGKCLSTEYINSHTKYEWECDKKHRWKSTAGNVRYGYWCPRCAIQNNADKKRKNCFHLHELASLRGGRCLSTEYINSQTKYQWGCENGHKFSMTANSVQQGQWCPHCANQHSKAELQIYEFVKRLFPDALNGQRKILHNPQFELDIYVPSLQKAIEFDGEFWHSRPEAQERDLRKNQECEAKGVKLLRISERVFLDNPQQVFENIKNFLTCA